MTHRRFCLTTLFRSAVLRPSYVRAVREIIKDTVSVKKPLASLFCRVIRVIVGLAAGRLIIARMIIARDNSVLEIISWGNLFERLRDALWSSDLEIVIFVVQPFQICQLVLVSHFRLTKTARGEWSDFRQTVQHATHYTHGHPSGGQYILC